MSLRFRLALVLGLYASLFFAASAPMLDHHYAERMPFHVHLYPGGVPVSHVHPYELPHDHPAGIAVSHTHPTGDGIIFLPARGEGATSVTGFGVNVLLFTALVALLVVPRTLFPYASASGARYRGFTPLPEFPPPRLAS